MTKTHQAGGTVSLINVDSAFLRHSD